MKRLAFAVWVFLCLLCFVPLGHCQYVTLQGTIQSANGLAASNYTISFTPSQFGFIAGTGALVNTTTTCATDANGSVVKIPNPLTASVVTASFTGTLPAGNYYVKYEWGDGVGGVTAASPESVVNLSATGSILVPPPASGAPSTATLMLVFIGTTSGSEQFQGNVAAGSVYTQSTVLSAGAAPLTTNSSVCKQVANDSIWPVGTGYTVSLTDPNGNTVPGYPMMWQLLGAGTVLNISNGLPYYHGVVTFPSPILASPTNQALQSINGGLSMTGHSILNINQLGLNTANPAYTIDVELSGSGTINADTYYSGGTAGFTGTKVMGACTVTFKGGLVTGVSGC